MRSIATQYATIKETVDHLPVRGSNNAEPSVATVQNAKRGIKGGKKRCRWCPEWVRAMADYDDDSDKKAGGLGMGCVASMHSGKR
jgi:hypothetical protein